MALEVYANGPKARIMQDKMTLLAGRDKGPGRDRGLEHWSKRVEDMRVHDKHLAEVWYTVVRNITGCRVVRNPNTVHEQEFVGSNTGYWPWKTWK